MKKAFGLRSSMSSLGLKKSSPSSKSGSEGSPNSKVAKPVTVGELMRVQMRVSEAVDSRIRRAMLRIAAGQVRSRGFIR